MQLFRLLRLKSHRIIGPLSTTMPQGLDLALGIHNTANTPKARTRVKPRRRHTRLQHIKSCLLEDSHLGLQQTRMESLCKPRVPCHFVAITTKVDNGAYVTRNDALLKRLCPSKSDTKFENVVRFRNGTKQRTDALASV